VPVATGTHAGQSTSPPTRAAPQGIRPRTAVEVLHSVSNWESANARSLLDAMADTTRRLTWLPLKLQTSQRHSAALCRVPDGGRKVCPVCPVQSAPGCRHRASERHIFGRRRRRTLNLAIRTLRIGCKRVFTGRPVELLSMRATAGALSSTSMNVSISRRPPRGHRGVRERNRYREPLRSVDIPSSRSFFSHTPAMRWLTRHPGYRGSRSSGRQARRPIAALWCAGRRPKVVRCTRRRRHSERRIYLGTVVEGSQLCDRYAGF
jgi:hypothetical protein